ncbi:hypothetical protein [Brevibacillus gelatini]|uniref:hypothetical protein n=1 Tax=Brevibacillus gelatini TaxID=1655277 RepID=UPI001FECE5A4|nr:hypothetical protein [Brevibacillus gelatini]
MEFHTDVEVLFFGKNLLGQPYQEVEAFVREHDPDLQTTGDGFTSFRYGFGVYAPYAFEDEGLPVNLSSSLKKAATRKCQDTGWSRMNGKASSRSIARQLFGIMPLVYTIFPNDYF